VESLHILLYTSVSVHIANGQPGMCHSSIYPGTSYHVILFYQAFPPVSTSSDKRWGEKAWVRGYNYTTHTHTQTCEKSEESLRLAAKISTRAGQQPAWCSGYRTRYIPCCGWTWPHRVSDCACVVMVMVVDGERGRRHMWSSSINDRSSHSYCTQQTDLIHTANSVLLSCEENWPLFNF